MNIFIDTSVVRQDPFWKNNSNNALLTFIQKYEVDLFISDIVVQELRKNYLKQIDEWERDRKSLLDKATALGIEIQITESKNSLEKKFDEFYDNLFAYPSIHKIEVQTFFYNTVMEWAIASAEPFFNKKGQFKDAVIWLSYLTEAKKNELKNCILLTNNSNDFCKLPRTDSPILNEELQKQGVPFKIYEHAGNFVRGEEKAMAEISVTKYAVFHLTIEEVHNHLTKYSNSIDEYIKYNIEAESQKLSALGLEQKTYEYHFRILEFLSNHHGVIVVNEKILYGRLIMDCHVSTFKPFGNIPTFAGNKEMWFELSFSYIIPEGQDQPTNFEIDNLRLMEDEEVEFRLKDKPRKLYHGAHIIDPPSIKLENAVVQLRSYTPKERKKFGLDWNDDDDPPF